MIQVASSRPTSSAPVAPFGRARPLNGERSTFPRGRGQPAERGAQPSGEHEARRRASSRWGLLIAKVAAVVLLAPAASAGQDAPSPAPSPVPSAALSAPKLSEVAPPEEAATVRYGNRPITVFGGRLFGRSPADRARAAVRRIEEVVELGRSGPVEVHVVGGVAILTVAGREVVTILPTDVDMLAGETVEARSAEAALSLRRVLAEVVEARSPRLLLRGALWALAATLAALVLARALWWLRGRAARRFQGWLDERIVPSLERHARGDLWRTAGSRLVYAGQVAGRLLLLALSLLLAYVWLTLVLRQFPYTRPWGEALRGFVLATLAKLGAGMVAALPGLFTVALIVLVTRLVVRATNAVFRAVEKGRLALPGVYAETAQPTRRLAIALLWLFALVVAYPYLPGSGTEAFKGVSVFVGLMLSLGSSGLVNQVMSSFMITYSRALRLGDYVRIGDVEGTVVHAGMLATKVLTKRNEEVTLPNAVVAASTITNYSRHSGEGVFTKTSVTIGYDTPWRQVEALLLLAASRAAGVRSQPPPRVLQTGLEDFYVEYTLVLALERPDERLSVLSELHGRIQDAFNEHGVQIMSPNYEADPAAPKVVPKSHWFVPPAKPGLGAT
jgi:small-conductance mechanosensitive channel